MYVIAPILFVFIFFGYGIMFFTGTRFLISGDRPLKQPNKPKSSKVSNLPLPKTKPTPSKQNPYIRTPIKNNTDFAYYQIKESEVAGARKQGLTIVYR